MGYFGIPFRNGVPIGLGSIVGFGAPQEFSPSELFLGGTAGAWYDPSDLTALFTTSAGATQCAMPGQGSAVSVGLMLDKSQGLVLGSELVTNGDFSGGTTGWSSFANTGTSSIAVVSGELQATTSVSQGASGARQVLTGLTSGRWYKVVGTGRVINNQGVADVGPSIRWANGDVTSGYSILAFSTSFSPTQISGYFLAGNSTVTLFLVNYGSGTTPSSYVVGYDNISVREVPGNHAIAFNDTTARPELRARVNLLVATATLSTQSVTTQATSYTLSFAGTGSITLSGTATGSYSAGTHTITCTAGTLTLTVSGTVTTADLRPANSGALLPAYQAVVDANTYDTSGFPLYLRFDGIDDSMYTPANLNLSGTDKVAVFAGVRKLSDAAVGIVLELSADWNASSGTFFVSAPDNTGGLGNYGSGSRGTAGAALSLIALSATTLAPVTNALTATHDIPGDLSAIRLNGAASGTNGTGDKGAGNFGTYPLYIGSRANSSLWFNGHLHSLIIAGSAVSASNISATEQWVAGRTGISIP